MAKKIDLDSAQQSMIQSEKMASLGIISAGIAHEINNPLSFLLSNIECLELYMGTLRKLIGVYEEFAAQVDTGKLPTQVRERLEAIAEYRGKKEVEYILSDYQNLLKESLEGVFRIRDIVQGLKMFSQPNTEELERVDLNDCIANALRVVSNELKYKCVLRKDLGEVNPIQGNPGYLLQVFVNILLNAVQAIEVRGVIHVSTYCDDRFNYAVIRDTGKGISDEHKKRLFAPFFTTKPEGRGTGLGLSVSYGIIKKLKGEIGIESEVGKGTTVTIKIPFERGDI